MQTFILKKKTFLLLCVFFSACGIEKPNYIYRLYFGMSFQGGNVTENQFNCFLDTAIAKRFPDGLTVYSVNGQWKQNDSIIKEKTKVVEIAGKNTLIIRKKIKIIRESYKNVFKQESVMFSKQKAQIDF